MVGGNELIVDKFDIPDGVAGGGDGLITAVFRGPNDQVASVGKVVVGLGGVGVAPNAADRGGPDVRIGRFVD